MKDDIIRMIESIEDERLIGQICFYIKYLTKRASTEK